jgi:hypothetical protein
MEGVKWRRPIEGVGERPTTPKPLPPAAPVIDKSKQGRKPDTPKPSPQPISSDAKATDQPSAKL